MTDLSGRREHIAPANDDPTLHHESGLPIGSLATRDAADGRVPDLPDALGTLR